MKKNIGFYSAIIQRSRFFMVMFCLILLTSWITPAFAATTPYGEALAAYKAKDYVRARVLFKPLAKEGNRKAMYAMGLMFTKGRGGELDDDLGELWLRRSAEKKYASAMMLLGKREVRKPEGQKDWQKGCMWFKKAAEQGHKDGMILTAICYKTGEGAPGISRDYVESLAWFMAAERKGVADGTEGRNELEKMVKPEDIPIAREKSKTLGIIKRPKKAATIASNTPKPKPALARPSSLPAPAQPKPVIAMPARPLPAKPVKISQLPVAKAVSKPVATSSSGKPPLQGQNAPKGLGVEVPSRESWSYADLGGKTVDDIYAYFSIIKTPPLNNGWRFKDYGNTNSTFTQYVDPDWRASKKYKIKLQIEFRKNKIRSVRSLLEDGHYISVSFDPDTGNVSAAAYLADSVSDGPQYGYFKNGRPKAIFNYYAKDGSGMRHGRYARLDEQGYLQTERFYEDNKKTGTWRQYRNGKLYRLNGYKNNREDGVQATYNNGNLVSWYTAKDGHRVGSVQNP